MKIYTVLSCIDCALKFAAALMTTFIDGHNALLYYATAIIIISLILVTAYYLVARKKYSECEYKLVTEKILYKKVLAFSGWTLYGALAGTTMIQGSVITLNFSLVLWPMRLLQWLTISIMPLILLLIVWLCLSNLPW